MTILTPGPPFRLTRPMPLSPNTRALAYQQRLRAFIDEHVLPNESVYVQQRDTGDRWAPVPIMETLKQQAQTAGLWNLFLPDPEHGAGLSNAEYAPLAELMGYYPLAAEATNCSAPDTGNMEVLLHYATGELRERYLRPLLDGQMRSAFCMTEPDVASSDATNIALRIERDGDHYVLNGRKWWSSGAGDPRCQVLIVMGKTDPQAERHRQQSMVVVPRDAEGVTLLRTLDVFGYDHAPHGHAEILFDDVRVPQDHLLLGEGRGFEIAQARLGPGRVHHCMRSIGTAERALTQLCQRAESRIAFGRPLSEFGSLRRDIAESRIDIDSARLLVLATAEKMDHEGNRAARREIAMIKAVTPRMAVRVLDRAIQAHGALGVSPDTFLAEAWAWQRALRFADGPDEVHLEQITKLELRKYA